MDGLTEEKLFKNDEKTKKYKNYEPLPHPQIFFLNDDLDSRRFILSDLPASHNLKN
jgi:hypothetical protein